MQADLTRHPALAGGRRILSLRAFLRAFWAPGGLTFGALGVTFGALGLTFGGSGAHF